MINALKELTNYGYIIDESINKLKISTKTYLEGDTLYYKSIPEGLMYLVNNKFNNKIEFNTSFETFGTMIDLSRGAVFKVEYLKEIIRKKAMMGINEIWLYIEDMYKLDDYETFGYLRGAYSKEELKEVVAYAKIFGITVIPAIQTLGHMEQFLRWNKSSKFKDQADVLLAESEETYKLIEAMLQFMKEVFGTSKIHIGLDETFGFGFGNYYKKNGYKEPINLFIDHLNKVNDIALTLGFNNILIWSDMLYRIQSSTNYYYDLNVSLNQELIDQIPKNIKLVYWDYYNENIDIVNKMLTNHKLISKDVVFASGTWIWTRLNYDKTLTDRRVPVHIEASKQNNINEFILTQWGDDGAYGDYDSTFVGVYENSLKALLNDSKPIKEVFEYINKTIYEYSVNITKINDYGLNLVGLLWDDPQFSLYLNNYIANDMENYNKLFNSLNELVSLYETNDDYLYEYSFVSALLYKVKARKLIIDGLMNKDDTINIENEINSAIKHLDKFISIFTNRWYERNKMNGIEIMQARIATQVARLKEMINLTNMYNDNKISTIEGILDEAKVVNEGLSIKHTNVAFTTKP